MDALQRYTNCGNTSRCIHTKQNVLFYLFVVIGPFYVFLVRGWQLGTFYRSTLCDRSVCAWSYSSLWRRITFPTELASGKCGMLLAEFALSSLAGILGCVMFLTRGKHNLNRSGLRRLISIRVTFSSFTKSSWKSYMRRFETHRPSIQSSISIWTSISESVSGTVNLRIRCQAPLILSLEGNRLHGLTELIKGS